MFHSTQLTQSIAALEPLTSSFKDKADHVSNDIRELENYLASKFFGIEVGLNVEDHQIDEQHLMLFKLADHSPVGGWLLREFLVWGKDEETQKFRLLYETHSLTSVSSGDYQVSSKKKPLIECSLFDRLRMSSKLPLLVDHIARAIL